MEKGEVQSGMEVTSWEECVLAGCVKGHSLIMTMNSTSVEPGWLFLEREWANLNQSCANLNQSRVHLNQSRVQLGLAKFALDTRWL